MPPGRRSIRTGSGDGRRCRGSRPSWPPRRCGQSGVVVVPSCESRRSRGSGGGRGRGECAARCRAEIGNGPCQQRAGRARATMASLRRGELDGWWPTRDRGRIDVPHARYADQDRAFAWTAPSAARPGRSRRDSRFCIRTTWMTRGRARAARVVSAARRWCSPSRGRTCASSGAGNLLAHDAACRRCASPRSSAAHLGSPSVPAKSPATWSPPIRPGVAPSLVRLRDDFMRPRTREWCADAGHRRTRRPQLVAPRDGRHAPMPSVKETLFAIRADGSWGAMTLECKTAAARSGRRTRAVPFAATS